MKALFGLASGLLIAGCAASTGEVHDDAPVLLSASAARVEQSKVLERFE